MTDSADPRSPIAPALADQQVARPWVAQGQHLPAGAGGGGHHPEIHLRGRPEKRAQLARIIDTGHLHKDTVRADPADDRLGNADLIHAVADHLKAAIGGAGGGTVQPGPGQGKMQGAFRHLHRERRGGAGLRRLICSALKGGEEGIICRRGKHQPIGADCRRAEVLRPHGGDKVFAQVLNAGLRQILAVHGQQQMRAALKIKAKGHGLAGGPAGQGIAEGLGEEIR